MFALPGELDLEAIRNSVRKLGAGLDPCCCVSPIFGCSTRRAFDV